MAVYSVFSGGAEDDITVLRDGFSWFAALLPPIWALRHGLWLAFIAILAIIVALGFAGTMIGEGAAFWLYVVLAVWLGFAASSIRAAKLRRRGAVERSPVIAADPLLAELAVRQAATDGR